MYMPNILGVFIFIFYVLFWLVIVLIYNIKKKKKITLNTISEY